MEHFHDSQLEINCLIGIRFAVNTISVIESIKSELRTFWSEFKVS